MKKTSLLRQLLQSEDILLLPGCFNPLSAILIENAGFNAAYISGAALAGNFLGYPDIGLVSMTEVLENAKNIVNATNLPLICDVDTGFGNAINVIRTVREFESIGLAGIQLEDQVMPKKCGHTEGKLVIPMEEMVQKLNAAVDSRKNRDFLIVARTDAIAVNGFEDALMRAHAYEEAGADILFVEAPRTVQEMYQIRKSVRAPLLANMVEGGKTPLLTMEELKEIGYKVAIYPVSAWMACITAMQQMFALLKAEGTTRSFASRMASFQEMFEIVGLSKYRALEKKYAASDSKVPVD
jgi:2,3-dimethylmalate lyase